MRYEPEPDFVLSEPQKIWINLLRERALDEDASSIEWGAADVCFDFPKHGDVVVALTRAARFDSEQVFWTLCADGSVCLL